LRRHPQRSCRAGRIERRVRETPRILVRGGIIQGSQKERQVNGAHGVPGRGRSSLAMGWSPCTRLRPSFQRAAPAFRGGDQAIRDDYDPGARKLLGRRLPRRRDSDERRVFAEVVGGTPPRRSSRVALLRDRCGLPRREPPPSFVGRLFAPRTTETAPPARSDSAIAGSKTRSPR
jgi:hypothetical protein